jgi:hypothetical protein
MQDKRPLRPETRAMPGTDAETRVQSGQPGILTSPRIWEPAR